MGFSYNVLVEHARAAHRRARDRRRRAHHAALGRGAAAQGDDEHAFKATVAHLAAPLLGASATTALGMLSLATSNVVAVRSFGIGSAVGIMVDFVISLVLVPTLLTLDEAGDVGGAARAVSGRADAGGSRASRLRQSAARARGLVALSARSRRSGSCGCASTPTTSTSSARDHPLGQSAAVIDNELSRRLQLPDHARGAARFAEARRTRCSAWIGCSTQLRQFPHVRKVTSVADYVKRINKELNDGRPAAERRARRREHHRAGAVRVRARRRRAARAGARRRERLLARADSTSSSQSMSSDLVLRAGRAGRRGWPKRPSPAPASRATTTGSGRLFSTLDHYLVTSQISSFGTAFVTVFGGHLRRLPIVRGSGS